MQPKNTVTVINQDSHKKIEVPIKPAKPDPNYIYDGGRKVESKPIVTKNPITGNLDRYELSAGAYSTSTAAKNLETKALQDYREYNKYRARVLDYPLPAYEDNVEKYQKIDFENRDVMMLKDSQSMQ